MHNTLRRNISRQPRFGVQMHYRNTHAHTHTRHMEPHTHTYTHTHTHTHTHPHTHTHIHRTHTPSDGTTTHDMRVRGQWRPSYNRQYRPFRPNNTKVTVITTVGCRQPPDAAWTVSGGQMAHDNSWPFKSALATHRKQRHRVEAADGHSPITGVDDGVDDPVHADAA